MTASDGSVHVFTPRVILQSPHLATRSSICPMSVLSHLSVLKPYFCTIFFQRDTNFVTAANETGGKSNMKVGGLLPLKVYPATNNGNHSTHL